MAEVDSEKLGELLEEIETSSQAVAEMLSALAADSGIIPPDFEPVDADEQGRLDEKAKVTCPNCDINLRNNEQTGAETRFLLARRSEVPARNGITAARSHPSLSNCRHRRQDA